MIKKITLGLRPEDKPGVGKEQRLGIFHSKVLLSFAAFLTHLMGFSQSQTFNASGSFTVPAGVTTVNVDAWGAGGAGGGTASTVIGAYVGGGGGGGGFTRGLNVSVIPGQTIPVTVGIGGTPVSGQNGNAGSASLFGSASPVTANGGQGGQVGNGTNNRGNGGAGGAGATFVGGNGGRSANTNNSGGGGGGAGNGGAGGNSSGSSAGAGGVGSVSGGAGAAGVGGTNNGGNGSVIGGGGSGSRSGSFSGARSGGTGGAGRVIVSYSCPDYLLDNVSAASLCGSGVTNVILSSSTLPSGHYTINYTISGATSVSQSVNVTYTAPGVITFATPVLNFGLSTITITSISSSVCSTSLTANNSVQVQVSPVPTAQAGPTLGLCETQSSINVTAGSTASNYSSILWTSNGTGTFSDATSLDGAVYTPSDDDILAGSVVITLEATGFSPCSTVNSTRTLEFTYLPEVTTGGPDTICSNQPITISGATAANGTFSWSHNGLGTLTNENTLTPTYTPVAADGGNTVILTLTVSNTGCGAVSSSHILNVTAQPVISAGSEVTICESEINVNFATTAAASNVSDILWTTNGSGILANATSLTGATYTPSASDISAGTVTFTLTGNGISPCSSASAIKSLIILQQPVAIAGGSLTICENEPAQVSGATAANGSIVWTENGAGSITAGASTLTPTYTPAAADAGNSVTLTMTVSNPVCTEATATFTFNVLPLPEAFAGVPVSICADVPSVNVTTGATVANNNGQLWTTSGTGTFSNADSITGAVYTPSAADISAGEVVLTLTAFGNGTCTSDAATKTLTILPVPVAEGATICQGTAAAPLTSNFICKNTPPITSSPRAPSTATTVGSGTAWTNPNNVFTNNNQTANVSHTVIFGSSSITSQQLTSTGMGFSIPSNATILGITATIRRSASIIIGSGNVQDVNVRIVKDGTVQGANKAISGNWPSSETAQVYGGSTDLWGLTWTPIDINDADFGVALVTQVTAQGGVATALVDAIQLVVTYSIPGTINWYTQASGGSAIGSGSVFIPVGVPGSGLPNTQTAGTYTFYAECSTVPGCRTAVNYVINPLPEVSISGLATTYCEDAAPVTITGNFAPSGTFAGTGIIDNGNGTAIFNPNIAGVGTHLLTYVYTNANGCLNTATVSVNVNANITYYADSDNDGFGNQAITQVSCLGAPAGFVGNSTDCDDTNPLRNAEFQFYSDNDGDGFGTGALVWTCAENATTPPANFSVNATDCDDNDASKNTQFDFYVDADGDGFGVGALTAVCAVDAATPPAGYSLSSTDCDDSDPSQNAVFLFFADLDGDGFGAGDLVEVCAVNATTPPAGYSLTGTDCNDVVSTTSPGAPEIGYNLTDDDCDTLIDEGFPPIISTITPSLCNTTLSAIDQQIFSSLVAGAQGYQWRITTISGPNVGQVQLLNTLLRVMRLSELVNFAYGATYQIEVAVFYQGFLQPYSGATCTVTTPLPTCQLVSCDQTLNNIQDVVFANMVRYATGYCFRITDPLNPANVQELNRNLREFRMSQITAFPVQYNKTYNVDVSVRNTDGTYLPYGTVCQVTTPLFPTTGLQDAQCDNGMGGAYEVPAMNTQIFANSWPGVIAYGFKLIGPGLPGGSAEVIKPLRVFMLSDFAAFGLQPGAQYNVQVRLIFNATDAPGPYGKVCTIKVPGASRIKPVEFKAIGSPNPFKENFSIDVTTNSMTDLTVRVYDMAGRMLEMQQLSPQKLKVVNWGAQYPSGIYTFIITQGDSIQTLRMIKR